MTKKFLISFLIILFTIFISTYSFAVMNEIENVTNNIKSGVNNIEQGMENVARDTSGAIKQGTQDVQNAGQNMTNAIMNDNNGTDATQDNNDNGYTAMRTATNTFGISNTMWTWIILAVIAAAIIGLIWYYVSQKNNSEKDY